MVLVIVDIMECRIDSSFNFLFIFPGTEVVYIMAVI